MEQVLAKMLRRLGEVFLCYCIFLHGVGLVLKVVKGFLQILAPLIFEIWGELGEIRDLLIEIFKLVM
ncbi:MAG: hypothetical protein KJ058_11835 [Thermoanaerobaculia bacterium]|nr:hypothetical protein [Thermoanaerobaculia bacterium]